MLSRRAVLIVVVLLAIVSAVAVIASMRLSQAADVAKSVRAANDTRFYASQLEAYRARHGTFPTTDQGLRALIGEPVATSNPELWVGPKTLQEIIRDDWDTPFIYRCPGIRHPDRYDLFSAGPDRKPDTKDDIWPD